MTAVLSLVLLVLLVGVLAAWATKRYLARWLFGAATLTVVGVRAIIDDNSTMGQRVSVAVAVITWTWLLLSWFNSSGVACLRGHDWVTAAKTPNGGTVSFGSNDPVMVRRLMSAAMVATDAPRLRACERCGLIDERINIP